MSGITVIKAAHYDETEERLTKDPIVIAMAHGLADVPREDIAHEDGGPTHEFMLAANEQYRKRGGKDGGHLGAIPNALLKLLDSGVVKPTKVVTYHANRSFPGAGGEENAAMAYASIVGKEPSLKEAKKELASYMTNEAMYLYENGGDWAVKRADAILAQLKELANVKFDEDKTWEALNLEADGLRFQLVRMAKDS